MKLIKNINKIVLFFVLAITLNTYSLVGQVAVSTNQTEADASAILEIESTSKGLLIPRITDVQRNILSNTAVTGLLVYSTDQNKFFYFNGTTWLQLKGNPVNNDWVINGNDMYMEQSGNVGIGVTSPSQQLEISKSMDMPYTSNSTTGVIYKGSDPFLHNFLPASAKSGNHNLFLGKDNGNFTMTAQSELRASRLLAIGSEIFPNVDSASSCMGIGYQSLNSQKSSSGNIAFGAFALKSSVKYHSNLVVGYQAAFNDTANRTTIIGSKANINTRGGGSKAISIGYNSASNSISGGINTSIGNNTQFAHTDYTGQLNIGNLIIGVGMGTGTEQFDTYMIHIGAMPLSGFGLENFNVNGDMRIGGTATGDYLDMSMTPGVGKFSLSDFGSGVHSFKLTMPNNAADTISFGGWYWGVGTNKLYESNWNLLSNGNFGVLTLSPDYKLQVNGTIAPETDGQDLGTSSLNWDAYLRDAVAQNVNISDVIVLSPQLSTYIPSNPVEGEIYVDHNHNIKCYLDGTWKSLNN